ncbi:DUF222 domain-containing protein [Actinoplanes sp. NPDC023801]|uniref:HNH endonuclease signature motif containing protein n=1 Tax=Actinoplanes sp. NPDC023801 TaxID=3154595 RepID=UPI0033DA4665
MPDVMQELADLAAQAAARWLAPLSQDELLAFLDTAHTAQQMLHAAVLHAVREADRRGVPAAQHAPSPQAWLRGRLRVSPAAAHRLLAQATTLERTPALDAAVATGKVNAEQLGIIAAALADLPSELDPQTRTRAGAMLTDWAEHLDPGGLRIAGRRVLTHVAPDAADAAEERWLRRTEREAHADRYLTMSPAGGGRVRVRGLLDTEAAAVVTAALDPLCKPDTAEISRTGAARTPGQQRADALVDVCRLALAEGGLPENGGDRPQLTVTVGYDPLCAKLGTGLLDNGEPLSAGTIRRLGCDARVLPVVLDGDSQILDAGRTRRTATGTMRRALNARDRGCAFPGCDRPPRWCEAHHIVSWADGGPTDLSNLVLLCGFHHRLIHDDTTWDGAAQVVIGRDVAGHLAAGSVTVGHVRARQGGAGWQVRLAADGHAEFLPPAWLDADRLPRRNSYHLRI